MRGHIKGIHRTASRHGSYHTLMIVVDGNPDEHMKLLDTVDIKISPLSQQIDPMTTKWARAQFYLERDMAPNQSMENDARAGGDENDKVDPA